MKGWETKYLGDVADLCLGKMLDEKKNRGESLPYLANVNVRWGAFDLSNLRQMRFEPHEMERYGLKYGDIVMCEGGEPGRCAIWKENKPGMMIQKALHRIRPHDSLDSTFLYYSFLHKGNCDGFQQLFTGSTIKHLPKQNLEKIEIKYPPLPVQQQISNILSTYDDLIENNRRRIALLEQSARLLYQEWFVRFRFPGHEKVKIVDGLPEGWSFERLKDITTKIGSGATPRGGEASYKDSGMTLIRSQNIYDYSFNDDGLVYIDDNQAKKLTNVSVTSNDILLNITGASVGRCCKVIDRILPARVNQHVMIIRADSTTIQSNYLLQSINSRQMKDHIMNIARSGGATREALTKDTIGNLLILIPKYELMEKYERIVADIFLQQQLFDLENKKLRQARDLLLPRLMSGEIAV